MHAGARRVMLVPAIALLLGACGSIEPWVQPYERDRLADPIMSFERDPASAAHLQKVFDIREGARGASGGSGGGCGCN
jgi:hypothetical protein